MSEAKKALRALGGAPEVAGSTLPNIPAVPPSDDSGVVNWMSSVKAWIERATGSGLSGLASRRELVNAGLATTLADGSIALLPVDDGKPKKLSILPKPVGLSVIGAMNTIIVEWSDPANVYLNHGHTEIWAAETDDFSSAVRVGQSAGTIFTHEVGPGAVRYYWIRFISNDNPPIVGAFNGVRGTRGETARDPRYLLELLKGEIGESSLTTLLRERVESIDGLKTNVQVNSQTIDGILGKYTVKIDNNGRVTGYGLMSTANDSGVISEFAVVADRFYIAPVDGAAKGTAPFYHLTAPTVINGVTIPAGTYLQTAFIQDASISTAKIQNLAVDNAKIASVSANKLTAGSVRVGEYIQSTGFMSRASGWRIDGNGDAEFNNLFIRANGTFGGELVAATGTFGGRLLAGTVDLTSVVGTTHDFTVPGNYQLTVPEGHTKVRITCVGGGGGGGAGGALHWTTGGGGGGGGAGVSAIGTFEIPAGTVLNIVVGAGGDGKAAVYSHSSLPDVLNGQSGGNSYVAGYIQSTGGRYGQGGGGGKHYYPGGQGGSVGGQNGAANGPIWDRVGEYEAIYVVGTNGLGVGGGGGLSYFYPGGGGGISVNSPDGGHGKFGSGGGGGAGYRDVYPFCGSGGNGGHGRVMIEFCNANAVVLRHTFDAHVDQFNALSQSFAAHQTISEADILDLRRRVLALEGKSHSHIEQDNSGGG